MNGKDVEGEAKSRASANPGTSRKTEEPRGGKTAGARGYTKKSCERGGEKNRKRKIGARESGEERNHEGENKQEQR